MTEPSSLQPPANATEQWVLTLLRRIQDGSLSPSLLSAADRQGVVEHLSLDGFSVPEVAEILKTSERTIARDRKAIKQANAIQRDPKMVAVVVGQLVREAETCVSRIRRSARERGATPAVKIDAEHRAWQIISDLTAKLQSLGYLPTATQQIEAQVTCRSELPPPEELQKELERLAAIQAETGVSDPAITAQLEKARTSVLQFTATQLIQSASAAIDSKQSLPSGEL